MSRFNKVLLLIPAVAEGKNVLPFYPLPGMGYLAETLRQHSIPYVVMDLRLEADESKLNSLIIAENVDFIGISMMSFHYADTYALINRIKQKNPGVAIGVGGPHISTFQDQALNDCPAIDYGFIMEGEVTLLELTEGKLEAEISGLIYRKNKEIVINHKRPFIKDLDSIPFPTYSGFPLEEYLGKQIAIITSRGCPFACVYCPVKTTIGQTFRARLPENILNEVRYWYGRGYREFLVQDDNFTLIPKRVLKFCQLIKDNQLADITFRLPNGIRADRLSLPLLQTMKEVGFKSLAFGVEAGNDKILCNIKKGETLADIRQGIKWACEIGFDVALFFIIGSPGETWEDVEDSFSLALDYPIKEANFYNLIPFPRTELFEWVQKNGYLLEPPEVYLNYISHFKNQPVFFTPQLSRAERVKAFAYAQKISKKIKRRGISERLAKWGVIGKLIAIVYTSSIFEKIYWENPRFRRQLDKLKEALYSE